MGSEVTENDDAGMTSQDVSLHAARGTAWTYLGFIGSRLLAFASSILLARLLIPEQFGLMSYCLMTIQFIEILNTFGMDAALIARRDRFTEAANTTFFVALAISLLTYAVAWFAAPAIASFFHAPEVTALLRVLALVLPIGSLDLVHHAIVQRQLRFKRMVLPEVAATLVKSGIAVYLAWKGYGAWSLVIGHLAGEVVTTLAYWLTTRWLPGWRFDAQVTREIARYGMHMVGAGFAGALFINLDYILVGRLLGTSALGFYTLGYRVPELVIRNFNFVVGRVGLPILARVQNDHELLRKTYLTYIRFVSLFVFPAGIGIAMTAHLFVPIFYTEKWLPTVGVMQILSVAMTVTPMGFLPGVLYKAVNRPEILTRLVVIKVPVAALLLWFGSRWGINGVAVGQLASIFFAVSLDALMVRRVFGVQGRQLLQALAPALGSTACMALVLGAVILFVAPGGLAGLLVLSLLGMLAYAGSLLVLSRETVWRTWGMLRQMSGKQGSVEGS